MPLVLPAPSRKYHLHPTLLIHLLPLFSNPFAFVLRPILMLLLPLEEVCLLYMLFLTKILICCYLDVGGALALVYAYTINQRKKLDPLISAEVRNRNRKYCLLIIFSQTTQQLNLVREKLGPPPLFQSDGNRSSLNSIRKISVA